MLELGITQAQIQFTEILNQTVLIVDKKEHNKKAVMLPYDEYMILVKKASMQDHKTKESSFTQFVGILDNTFVSNDVKYNEIIK
jgi:hypothetical protein